MKVLTLTLAVFLFSLCNAQITTTKVAEAPVKKYDSTENIMVDHVERFIGQDVYVNGMAKELREFGYDNFIIDYTKDKWTKTNIYKINDDGINSKYDSLVGKYFTVVDVINTPGEDSTYFLKLQEKGNNNIVYYIYNAGFPESVPFITTGYFLKQRQAVKGKKFIMKGENWMDGPGKPMLDLKTGLPVSDFKMGSVWTTIDFTVDEKYYALSLILENAKHEQIALPEQELENGFWVIDYDKSIQCQKKFGNAVWQLALQGRVQKGMTKEVCEMALGRPKNVTKTVYEGKELELWTYDFKKLYFRDGLLIDPN
jgi:hypothetical protein